jgi:hypothetical protein
MPSLASHRCVRAPSRPFARRLQGPHHGCESCQPHASTMNSHADPPRRSCVRSACHAQDPQRDREAPRHAAYTRPACHSHQSASHDPVRRLTPHRRVRLPRRPLAPRPPYPDRPGVCSQAHARTLQSNTS